ncbi:MAG: histidine kinase [Mycobacteriaceae bacterium]
MSSPDRLARSTSPWPGARRRLATVSAVSAALLSTILAVSLASKSHELLGTGTPSLIALGGVLNTAAGVALVWRYRWSWWVFLLALAGPVAGETDALALLVALVVVLRVEAPRRAAAGVGLAFLGVLVSLAWDAGRGDSFSVLRIWDGPVPERSTVIAIAWWVPPLVAVVSVALVTGLGLLLRTRNALSVAVDRGNQATAERRWLREEAVRAEERSRIARDMHDTLANRLSRISLLAGGLHAAQPEKTSADPVAERVRERAQQIHGAAHEAMDELKAVVGVLRGREHTEAAPPGLDAVPALVEAARRAGVHVRLLLDVSPEGLDPETSHAAFRLVQEGITNVQKHAADGPAEVSVTASRPSGVWVQVRNPLPSGGSSRKVGGNGLVGLTEQVGAVGGRVKGGVEHTPGHDRPEFVLCGWLPWRR